MGQVEDQQPADSQERTMGAIPLSALVIGAWDVSKIQYFSYVFSAYAPGGYDGYGGRMVLVVVWLWLWIW
jgi:hypothetical protein